MCCLAPFYFSKHTSLMRNHEDKIRLSFMSPSVIRFSSSFILWRDWLATIWIVLVLQNADLGARVNFAPSLHFLIQVAPHFWGNNHPNLGGHNLRKALDSSGFGKSSEVGFGNLHWLCFSGDFWQFLALLKDILGIIPNLSGVPTRTSTSQIFCQIECQNIMHRRSEFILDRMSEYMSDGMIEFMSDRMSDWMSDRMSKFMSDRRLEFMSDTMTECIYQIGC